jgi:hypothetical protein
LFANKGRPAAAALSAARSPDAPCRLPTSPSRNHGWQRVELSAALLHTKWPVCFRMAQALCSHDGEILDRASCSCDSWGLGLVLQRTYRVDEAGYSCEISYTAPCMGPLQKAFLKNKKHLVMGDS